MRFSPPETTKVTDPIQPLPCGATEVEAGAPVSDTWDSEAPTAVLSRRPLFAGPPRLPSV